MKKLNAKKFNIVLWNEHSYRLVGNGESSLTVQLGQNRKIK